MAAGDEDALRSRDIIIATPEKLDFALRNDPTIIDDVGLVVLDEGHLIGPSEREIRYENSVQRLLRRPDSPNRRLVCLSAILPEGDQLDHLTAWIRSDAEGTPIQSRWRPTRQKFGTLAWQRNSLSARLSFDLEAGGPYIRHFILQVAAIPPRRTPFPKDNKELTLAAAWKFSDQGKRALIFCTQRDHVEGYAEPSSIFIGVVSYHPFSMTPCRSSGRSPSEKNGSAQTTPLCSAFRSVLRSIMAGCPAPFYEKSRRFLPLVFSA